MFKKSLVIGATALSLMCATAFAKDVATVNGKGIPQEKSDSIVKMLVSQRGAKDTPELRKGIREDLIMDEIMVQEAQKKGLDSSAEVKQNLENARRGILKQALIQDFVKKNPVSDKDVKAEYDQVVAARKGKEYHAKQIVVKTEAEAKDIVAQLGKGGNFEKLAASKSLDKSAAKNGGDLGWVPAKSGLGNALSKLKNGQTITAPVNGAFVVVKLVESRDFNPPKFEQVKDGLKADMEQAKFGQYVRALREKAKVE